MSVGREEWISASHEDWVFADQSSGCRGGYPKGIVTLISINPLEQIDDHLNLSDLASNIYGLLKVKQATSKINGPLIVEQTTSKINGPLEISEPLSELFGI